MLRAFVVVVLAQPTLAQAESSVKVSLNEDGQLLADRLGISVPVLVERARARIEELFKVARLDDLLPAFADTGSFSQRTTGVDYDIDPGDLVVGASALGIHADMAIGSTSSWLGSSIVNLSTMAGLNLERWRRPRWTVFANGFYQATTIRGLVGHLLTLGSHVQYRALAGTRPGSIRWTGVSLTTGVEYARWTITESAETPIDTHFTAEGNDEGVVDRYTIHMSSTGRLDVISHTLTVPIEATTGVRVFERLGLYGGGGLDLTEGSSTIIARLQSELSYTSDRIPVGNAEIVGSGDSEPTAVTVHGLVGLAVHLRRVKLFCQGVTAPGMSGVNLGARGRF
jgi:hypothetical protein